MKQNKNNMQIVFVVGSGRSGTTLLRNILQHHAEIGVTPELQFFSRIISDRKRFGNLINIEAREKLIEHAFKKISQSNDPLWKLVKVDFDSLKEHLLQCSTYKEMFLALAKFTCPKTSPRILIEKSPPHIFYLEQIIDLFPECKIIHMLRDGREFCASAKKENFQIETLI